MKSSLHIGADAEQTAKTLPEITKALLSILNTPAGDAVKQSAISALTSAFKVEGVSVNNCNFENRE